MNVDEIDYEGFARALDALRTEVASDIGERDFAHFEKVERWGRLATAAGYATAWLAPNPVSALLMSLGSVTRWTTVMHHASHRAFDGVPGVSPRYTSREFAQGERRFVDWFDWILPEAWHYEHDVLHHYHTGEIDDPDLVEERVRWLRELPTPRAVKYAIIALYASTWRLTYYAPNTFLALLDLREKRAGRAGDGRERSIGEAFDLRTAEGREFWRRCLLPYGLARFGFVPLAFLPLGPLASVNVLLNSALAEVLTNLHTFLVIVPNHAGEDVFRFEGRCRGRAEFYVRQVMGSVNYRGGSEWLDFLQGYLNYQIEHHLFPDLPPLKYREIKPRVQAICARFGVPYMEESVFARARKLVALMVGDASMKRTPARASARPRAGEALES